VARIRSINELIIIFLFFFLSPVLQILQASYDWRRQHVQAWDVRFYWEGEMVRPFHDLTEVPSKPYLSQGRLGKCQGNEPRRGLGSICEGFLRGLLLFFLVFSFCAHFLARRFSASPKMRRHSSSLNRLKLWESKALSPPLNLDQNSQLVHKHPCYNCNLFALCRNLWSMRDHPCERCSIRCGWNVT